MNTLEIFFNPQISESQIALWKGKSVKEVAAAKYPTAKLRASSPPPRSLATGIEYVQFWTLEDDDGYQVWLIEVS